MPQERKGKPGAAEGLGKPDERCPGAATWLAGAPHVSYRRSHGVFRRGGLLSVAELREMQR